MACNLKDDLATLRERPEEMDEYAEWDTRETIEAIETALAAEYEVVRVVANDLPEAFDTLRELEPDVVFNVVEGRGGVNRESHFPALCEALGIPYTGSDPLTLALCLDKARAKEVLTYHGVPTPAFLVVRTPEDTAALSGLGLPAVVKPLHEGSSKGITNEGLVREPGEARARALSLLQRYGQPALVERFMPGREFTVALIGNGEGVEVLPLVEISFDDLPPGTNPIYSFEAKWIWDTPEAPKDVFLCPAPVDSELRERIEKAARRAFVATGCRDWCRIDVRLDEAGVPHVLELNPLPGVLPRPEDNSCFPKAASRAGLTYEEMIRRVLVEALRRHGRA